MAANGSSSEEDSQVSGSRKHQGTLVVAVEGNISSGKSTFLNFCSSRANIDVYPEPVEKWRNVKGENLLARYYENPRKWAVTFQLYVNMTMLDIYKQHSPKQVKVVERSLLSSRYCFLASMQRSGVLDPAMAHVLDEWYVRAWSDHQSKPHVIVYLRTSPTVSLGRLRSRARGEEATVGLAYLEELHQLHESWLASLQASNLLDETDIPIYVIDANQPMGQMYAKYEACLDYINLLTM